MNGYRAGARYVFLVSPGAFVKTNGNRAGAQFVFLFARGAFMETHYRQAFHPLHCSLLSILRERCRERLDVESISRKFILIVLEYL